MFAPLSPARECEEQLRPNMVSILKLLQIDVTFVCKKVHTGIKFHSKTPAECSLPCNRPKQPGLGDCPAILAHIQLLQLGLGYSEETLGSKMTVCNPIRRMTQLKPLFFSRMLLGLKCCQNDRYEGYVCRNLGHLYPHTHDLEQLWVLFSSVQYVFIYTYCFITAL